MRLINVKSLALQEFPSHRSVSYAILSHRWEEDEVSFEDMTRPERKRMKGYKKINAFCRTVQEELRPMSPDYVWVDTCCIDKRSSAELSEAINSMFEWYGRALRCYAFLSDVDDINDLERSVWFKRCWTLQELIAPISVLFYNKNWRFLGDRNDLAARISRVTRIPESALAEGVYKDYSVAQRMSWAAYREATRIEDQAYSLMGLFDVNMPMLYGEGDKAFTRLQEEIIRQSDDHSIFCWDQTDLFGRPGGLLAGSPRSFRACDQVVQTDPLLEEEGYSMTNAGLAIRFLMVPWRMKVSYAVLNCTVLGQEDRRESIVLRQLSKRGQYARIASGPDGGPRKSTVSLPMSFITQFRRCHSSQYTRGLRTLVRSDQRLGNDAPEWYGFFIEEIQRLDGSYKHSRTYRAENSPQGSLENPLECPQMSGELYQSLGEDGDVKIWLRTFTCAREWDTKSPGYASLQAGQYGTVCAILYEGARVCDLAEVRLGFDWEFRPLVMLRWNGTNTRWRVHSERLDNSWIDHAQTYLEASKAWPDIFKPYGPPMQSGTVGECIIRVDTSPFLIHVRGLDLEVELVKRPMSKQQQIWTVCIRRKP